jgi:hypothetical protein
MKIYLSNKDSIIVSYHRTKLEEPLQNMLSWDDINDVLFEILDDPTQVEQVSDIEPYT